MRKWRIIKQPKFQTLYRKYKEENDTYFPSFQRKFLWKNANHKEIKSALIYRCVIGNTLLPAADAQNYTGILLLKVNFIFEISIHHIIPLRASNTFV